MEVRHGRNIRNALSGQRDAFDFEEIRPGQFSLGLTSSPTNRRFNYFVAQDFSLAKIRIQINPFVSLATSGIPDIRIRRLHFKLGDADNDPVLEVIHPQITAGGNGLG